MVRRVAVGALRAAKEPASFLAWVERIDEEHGDVIRAALGPIELACKAVAGPTFSGAAGWLLDALKLDLVAAAGESTAKALAEDLQPKLKALEAKLAAELSDLFEGKS
jgi:hypothetical protein